MSSIESFSASDSEIHGESTSQDKYKCFEVEGIDCEIEEESNSLELYVDEPLAGEEWLEKYNQEREEMQSLEDELKKRLENSMRVGNWYVQLLSKFSLQHRLLSKI